MNQNNESNKSAYMIISGNVIEPDKMGPYIKAAGPLFAAAGIEQIALGVAGSSVQILEGQWPYQGALMLYKCRSMEQLIKFWNSPEYQEAIKLRDGIVESNFSVAIEESD